MLECNPARPPGYGPEQSNEQPEEKLLGAQGIKLYQAIVVSAFARDTRYDICYAVNRLRRARSKPSTMYMTAGKHMLGYLKRSPDLAIICKQRQFTMYGYTHALFPVNPEDRHRQAT